jgi:hypothetical protein
LPQFNRFRAFAKGGAVPTNKNFIRLALLILLCPSLLAQKQPPPAAPKYDVHTEAKFKGIIEEVKLPPKGSEKEITYLRVKKGDDVIDIYLCPKAFFDDMSMAFAKGDEVTLTGSKVKQGEAELVLAREVMKGNDTFVLRDEKGGPVWNWHK